MIAKEISETGMCYHMVLRSICCSSNSELWVPLGLPESDKENKVKKRIKDKSKMPH